MAGVSCCTVADSSALLLEGSEGPLGWATRSVSVWLSVEGQRVSSTSHCFCSRGSFFLNHVGRVSIPAETGLSQLSPRALQGGHECLLSLRLGISPFASCRGLTGPFGRGSPGCLPGRFASKATRGRPATGRRLRSQGAVSGRWPLRSPFVNPRARPPTRRAGLYRRKWFTGRLAAAAARRAPLLDRPAARRTTAHRLVHGENDGLPGFVVDRYAETLVVKLYTAAWVPHLRDVLAAFTEIAPAERCGIGPSTCTAWRTGWFCPARPSPAP